MRPGDLIRPARGRHIVGLLSGIPDEYSESEILSNHARPIRNDAARPHQPSGIHPQQQRCLRNRGRMRWLFPKVPSAKCPAGTCPLCSIHPVRVNAVPVPFVLHGTLFECPGTKIRGLNIAAA